MAKLSRQLQYFVNKKVSEDTDWQGCEIVLSGHEVPGEGEHKIMEYIRNAKSQPGYDSNVRHCLYGLDADLIMLGLLSHDPHFSLLREEVTFGRASKNKSKELEHQNFFLLHLCMVREYLEMEFQELKLNRDLGFEFDLERVIDDFILMAFFVGNDFLPNLPGLHINEGALADMFEIYKRVLPEEGGYLHENGVLNIKRALRMIAELGKVELKQFEHDVADERWFASKQMEKKLQNTTTASAKTSKGGQRIITTSQRDLWKQKIRPYVSKRSDDALDLGAGLSVADKKFAREIADAMHLDWSTKEDDNGFRHFVISFPPKPAGDDEDGEDEEEGNLAAYRVIKTYDKAVVVNDSGAASQEEYEKLYKEKHQGWKTKYYLQKFPEWEPNAYADEQTSLCENYVEGLQWVLFYYYRGIASWPWFYKYHYAPLISDVAKGANAKLVFEKGQPFKPYEQLMGVLPDRSKKIVPTAYHDLMTNPSSPIIDFYPRDFELDMNGKKMDWEAVIKIPFIDEKRLLAAMETKNALLSDDEKARNGFGVPLKFTYSPEVNFTYLSPLPGIFPDVQNCRCIENIFDLPNMEGLVYKSALTDGAKLKMDALAGFPSLHTLPHTAQLIEGYGVNVFQADSRNPSVIVTLTGTEARSKTETWKARLGKKCFVGYPFLQEAKVVNVQDELFTYELGQDGVEVVMRDNTNRESANVAKEADHLESWHAKRLGVTIGQVECLIGVHMLKGLLKTEEGALVKEYAENPSVRSIYASQTVVDEVMNEDERFIEKAALPIEEEFPQGTRAFFLGDYAYGRPLEITGHIDGKTELVVSVPKTKEPEFSRAIIRRAEAANPYTPSFAIAKQLGVHPLVLSKITSSFQVLTSAGLKLNLGLNLKFEGRKLKVLGYSRKSNTGWEFSNLAVALIANYMVTFPDFFAAVQKHAQKSDVYDTDLWPDSSVASQRLKELSAWLKKQETSKFEKVTLDAEQLDSDIVTALAKVGEEIFRASQDSDIRKMRGVPRTALLKPSDAEMVLGSQTFKLGDRVTFVAAAGKVPIATRGTVVGISRTPTALLLDVVWDTSFMSGTTLGERAPMFRGQTVPALTVLNTTTRQVLSASSKSQQRRAAAAPNKTTGGYAPAGVIQYKDAQAPGPLRGGWSGAVNGRQSSGRGRGRGGASGGAIGGANGEPRLLHSTMVYRDGPHGNSQSNGQDNRSRGGHRGGAATGQNGEQKYGNVPPPANLTGSRGGRGRGRGNRGRGNGNRGRGGAAGNQEAKTA